MKFLVTNDDGYDAPGIRALLAAARQFGETVLVAPAQPQSGCSHRVTTDQPVQVQPSSEAGGFIVHGTPADCVRIGLSRLVPDADWILSGINAGGNLGADIYYSGTVAAVREGVLHGWKGIAFSHFRQKGREYDWPRAQRWAEQALADLLVRPLETGAFWNLNFPHLLPEDAEPSRVECALDPLPLPLSYFHQGENLLYNGNYHHRRRTVGCDVDICFRGNISVTKLKLF